MMMMNLSVPLRWQVKVEKEKLGRVCGSATHKISSHKDCPFNKGRITVSLGRTEDRGPHMTLLSNSVRQIKNDVPVFQQ